MSAFSTALSRPVSSSATPAASPAPAVQPQAFANVQDRVVQALLRRGLVQAAQVTEAEKARTDPREPLWRALAGVPHVDRDKVFEQAAATYAFRLAPVKDREPEAEFAKTVIESFDAELGKRQDFRDEVP